MFHYGREIDIDMIILMFSVPSIIYNIHKSNLENKIKSEVLPSIRKLFGELKWVANYNDDSSIEESNLIPRYNRHDFDDIFMGKYNDIPFNIYKGEFRYKTKTSKRSSTKTVFTGVILEIQFNKNFVSNTVIKPNSFMPNKTYKNLRKKELEDVIFEKEYDVYTNDEVDARYY